VKLAIDFDDRQFLERLHRLRSATVQELCAETGVTATAVRQRLTRLQGLGLVGRETVRHGRGRPHHSYVVTEAGLRELGDNYAELAIILWREMRQIEDPAVRERIAARVREALVQRYGQAVQGASVTERFTELMLALNDRGFDVEVDASGGLPILRENNCPYHELAASDPAICELEHAVFQRVLGTELALTQCCLDGHACCEFQPGQKRSGGNASS
jgi:predicted ArsR family transcriptional regulator